MNNPIDIIQKSILSLKPAGADGFEGLLRLALTELTGISFRLAASGLQRRTRRRCLIGERFY